VQEVPRKAADKNAFQELDQTRLFESCSKWVRRVDEATRIDDYVDTAFTIAATGRPGPVVLLVPVDFLDQSAEAPSTRTVSYGFFPLDRVLPDRARIAEAARLLSEAQAPLIVAGGGVHLSQACSELARLQDSCHLPVATTNMGKGAVDENHPLSLGVVGEFMAEGSRTHNFRKMARDADVILFVGNRTNQDGTDSWRLFSKQGKFIHNDIDGGEIGRNYEALRLVGDTKLTLEALASWLLTVFDLRKRLRRRPEVEKEIADGIRRFRRTVAAICASDQRPIRPERLMADLDSILTAETIVTADASYASAWAFNYLTCRAVGSRFLAARGLAGLGWGFPLAIGAKIARPHRPVICIEGDGGFAHCWAEVETSVRMNLGVVVIVLNNQVLGYTKDDEDAKFGNHTEATELKPVDHAAIAKACGAAGVRIENAAEFLPAVKTALGRSGPTILDVMVDPNARPPVNLLEGKFAAPFEFTFS